MAISRIINLLIFLSFGMTLIGEDAAVTRTTDGGQHRQYGEISVISVVGDATMLGRQAGELIAPQTQAMLTAIKMHPRLSVQINSRDELDNKNIPNEYRDEITAWARAAACDPTVLLRANLAVDSLCTAVVKLPNENPKRPLLIARNMDFAPAQFFGKKTVIIARRPLNNRASLSIGWPGYVGVISGINDAGVCACLLLNLAADNQNKDGDSIGLRLRAILDNAKSLEEAVNLFAAAPIKSSHYVLLADQKSARVMWWNNGTVHHSDPSNGWLFCTNARISPDSHLPEDKRGQHAFTLSREQQNPDIDWMKRILTATYMPGTITAMNAQAMIFIPETGMLHLALYGTTEAALSPWHELNTKQLLAGADLATISVTSSPAVSNPFQHYTQTP